jgi:hypothetical protein
MFIVVVFDAHGNGNPIMCASTSNIEGGNLALWIIALKDKMARLDPDWRPNTFMIDNNRIFNKS